MQSLPLLSSSWTDFSHNLIVSTVAMTIIGLMSALFYSAIGYVQKKVGDAFVFVAEIPQSSEAYWWVRGWISSLPEVKGKLNRVVVESFRVGGESASVYTPHCSSDIRLVPHDSFSSLISFCDASKITHKIIVSLTSSSSSKSAEFAKEARVILRIPQWPSRRPSTSPADIVVQIVAVAKKHHRQELFSTVQIFVPERDYSSYWRRLENRPMRPIDTVFLRRGAREQVVADVRDFIEAESWYRKRGVPWRRGYLFHGPPGTGKTSFITALAGELEVPLCVLSLSGPRMEDETLLSLLNSAPSKAIILIEDVDAVISNGVPWLDVPEEQDPLRKMHAASKLTFSGLLNAIDGVAAQEGRLLMMTTNHVEKLDPALKRPGRTDVVIEFGLADEDQCGDMFRSFFEDSFPSKDDLDAAELVIKRKYKSRDNLVAPAVLQGFFMERRKDVSRVSVDLSSL